MIKYDVPLDLGDNINLSELVSKIKKGAKVLEFGPSTGRLTRYLKENLDCEVSIVEIDEVAYQECMKFANYGVCGDIEDFVWEEAFKGKKYDYIIFADVLEHLRDPKNVVEHVKKYLKKEGKVLVSIPNISHNAIVLQLLNQRFDYHSTGLLDNTHIHFFTMQTCQEMFVSCGFHVCDCDGTFAEAYDTELQMTYEGIPTSVADYLASRDYGNLYQIVYEFSLTETKNEVLKLHSKKQREYFCKMFFDYGEGFREEDSCYVKLSKFEDMQKIIYKFDRKTYVKAMAFVPLDHFWSKVKINGVIVDGNDVFDKMTNEGYMLKQGSEFVSLNQKFIFPIDTELVNIVLLYSLQVQSIDDVLQNFYKETLTLHYEIGLNKEEIKNVQNAKEQCEERMLEVGKEAQKSALLAKQMREHYFDFSLENEKQKKKPDEFSSKLINAVYRWTKKHSNRKQYNVKMLFQKKEEKVLKYTQNAVFSNVENYLALETADYCVIVFEGAELKETFYETLDSLLGEHLVMYSDSYRTQYNSVWYKAGLSIDYMENHTCEFDVIVIHRSVLQSLQASYGLDVFANSHFAMMAINNFVENIHHIQKPLYETRFMDDEVLDYQNPVYQKVLTERYSNNYSVENGELRFLYTTDTPKIGIIIPTKDKVELLNACVESILSISDYNNYEIIILNNNSELEETAAWFKNMQISDKRVRVVDAFFEFNWSKLNNFGMQNSTADVYVFLNNDTIIKSPDWMQRLAENALRPDAGVVGALLLYEDHTIQHAGVVVGMSDFADHIYKGERTDCKSSIFVSPLCKRNVLAVTGACMAISKHTIETIGYFNEEFIICGSDVEICLRAYRNKLVNVYEPKAVLYHLESKSRDSYIPEIDFVMSEKHYKPYRSEGDPYFNNNLNKKATTPTGGR